LDLAESSPETTEEINDPEANDTEVNGNWHHTAYIAGAIFVVLAVIGIGWWIYSRQFITTDDAFVEGNITIISSKLSAHVTKVHVTENQRVKKGDLLIELDSSEADAKAAQAKAAYQTALANLDKAKANVQLARMTGKAGINEASSNLKTSRTGIEQTKIQSSQKLNSVDLARNQADTAAANLKQTEAQVFGAEAAIEQAKAQVNAAKNRLDVAQTEVNRDQRLFKDGIVSNQKLDQTGRELSEARASHLSAEKQVEIAQSRHNALQRQVDADRARLKEAQSHIAAAENDYRQSVSQIQMASSGADESQARLQDAAAMPARVAVEESEVGSAQAEVEKSEAAVNQAELEQSYTKLFATQDGNVSRKAVQEGQLVQADQALLTITQEGIWVIANFKETQLEKIHPGNVVDIKIDAYPGTTFYGKIDSVQAGTGSRFSLLPAENATGSFVKVVQRVPVKIVFDEMPDSSKYVIVPGMSAVPRVHTR
jgi:membrane fusion protein, multidrug efflux system